MHLPSCALYSIGILNREEVLRHIDLVDSKQRRNPVNYFVEEEKLKKLRVERDLGTQKVRGRAGVLVLLVI
jgi:hypothetical protein